MAGITQQLAARLLLSLGLQAAVGGLRHVVIIHVVGLLRSVSDPGKGCTVQLADNSQ